MQRVYSWNVYTYQHLYERNHQWPGGHEHHYYKAVAKQLKRGDTMHSMSYFLAIAVLVLTTVSRDCVAQAPPTIEFELNKYGVPATQMGLQSALTDHRPEVRGLAASKLAAMEDTASVPLLVKALEREKYPLVRISLAIALISLNSQVGTRALLRACNETSLPEGLRLRSAGPGTG